MNVRVAALLATVAVIAATLSILHGCGDPPMNEPPPSERGKGPSAGAFPEGTAQSVIDENK